MGVEPQAAVLGQGFWIPREGADAQQGAHQTVLLAGDEDVEVVSGLLGIAGLDGADLVVPGRQNGVCGNGRQGGVDVEADVLVLQLEKDVGELKVLVESLDLFAHDLFVDVGRADARSRTDDVHHGVHHHHVARSGCVLVAHVGLVANGLGFTAVAQFDAHLVVELGIGLPKIVRRTMGER